MKIVLKPYGADEPGYLRRNLKIVKLQKRIEGGDLEALDDLVTMFADRVEGATTDGARDAILDLSQNEFDALIASMTGASDAPLD